MESPAFLTKYYNKKHRGGCARDSLWPGLLITNQARTMRLVLLDFTTLFIDRLYMTILEMYYFWNGRREDKTR